MNYRYFIKKPKRAFIEVTNHCNLNCQYCLVGRQGELSQKGRTTFHNEMERSFGYMSWETLNKAGVELKQFGIKDILFFFQGEPLLHKEYPEMVKFLVDLKFVVSCFTNGTELKKTVAEQLIKNGISKIRFSIDGASQETYNKNRIGGDFDRVIKNLKDTVLLSKGTKTKIEWQYIILSSNEHEIQSARKMAKEIGVDFFTKGFRESVPDLIPKNPAYRSKYLKKPCNDIFNQIGICWNGDVVPCCYDIDGKEIMGNVTNETLSAIWKKKTYAQFRKNVRNVNISPENEPKICIDCLRWK